ncbi:MAG: ParB N-terminal domain-containing protein, partial [Chloroflexota bacterium]
LWGGDPLTTGDLFDEWLERIHTERDSELIWRDRLTDMDTLEESSRGKNATDFAETLTDSDALSEMDEALVPDMMPVSPMEASFLRLVDLAASIKRDGLTNPITVAKHADSENSYVIETGERRWLAYHLLRRFDDAEQWAEIPAREVRETSVWRQATENNARDDLNAIAKARQLALLLMDIFMRVKDEEFAPRNAFDHERDFYAQVKDGKDYRIPRGFGEKLLNAMGLSSASHLRYYRGILRVDSDLWDAADDANWTERDIRDKWRRRVESAPKRDPGHGSQPAPSTDPKLAERNRYAREVKEIARLAQQASEGQAMSEKKRLEAVEKIKSLQDWLKQQEKLISSK